MTTTKGPWTVSPHLENSGSRIVMGVDDEGEPTRVGVTDCKTKHKRGEGWMTECAERDANARLMAAAPDMLDALKEARDHVLMALKDHPVGERLSALQTAYDAMCAALAKAEGKP
jgi:hypothetical protein